jgi:hypothetical protein
MSAEENLNPEQFYHGGNTKRAWGSTIDPSQPHEQVHRASLPNQAYLTQRPDEAQAYARMAQKKKGGAMHAYKVEPQGEVTPDRTVRQGGSFMTRHPVKVAGEVWAIRPPRGKA